MLTIVTANWNGESILKNYLDSLVNQVFKDFRVIIVDNGSIDKSLDILKKYQNKLDLKVVALNLNTGFATANNIGIDLGLKDIKTEYIVTLNNDIVLDPLCFSNFMYNLKKTEDHSEESKCNYQILSYNYFNKNLIDFAGLQIEEDFTAKQVGYGKKVNLVDLEINVDGACAGAAIFSKDALIKIKENDGYIFDPTYFAYFEDVDLAIRLKEEGFKTKLLKDSFAFHHHSATSKKDSKFKNFYYTRNLYIINKKFLNPQKIKKKERKLHAINLARIVKAYLKLNFDGALGIIEGYKAYKKNDEAIKSRIKNRKEV